MLETMKTCTKCKADKPRTEFNARSSAKDGLRPECRECHRASYKRYVSENHDRVRELKAAYRKENRSKLRIAGRTYYLANKDKWLVYSRLQYERHPEEMRAKVRRQYRANIEQRRAYGRKQASEYARLYPEVSRNNAHRRRTRKRANGVFEIPKSFLKRLYKSSCFYCGSRTKITADHVIPISRGGAHSMGNLVPACQICNFSKHNKTIMEWRATC